MSNDVCGDFCDIVMKCFVFALQTNFSTGTNRVSHYSRRAELRRDAVVIITVTSLAVTPVTVLMESYGAVQHYRQKQLSDEMMTAWGLHLYQTDIKHREVE